ncbi:hypothetical protein CYMTET_23332 [Cymbomonas tetramitiformis]|uniref:Right handed beta helix domain-containing protein n=1 Tax=Cymbomonas tetramitiformis TaxID=36881 RepID=A0AAE0FYD4_9CHLO|nr:hypothetical protein CYMTET_23332 [Cymbomonas tetramitiformis]
MKRRLTVSDILAQSLFLGVCSEIVSSLGLRFDALDTDANGCISQLEFDAWQTASLSSHGFPRDTTAIVYGSISQPMTVAVEDFQHQNDALLKEAVKGPTAEGAIAEGVRPFSSANKSSHRARFRQLSEHTFVNITNPNPESAGADLSAALADFAVVRIWLFVHVSITTGHELPSITRAVEIVGRCADEEGGQCEVNGGFSQALFTAVGAVAALRLEALALRFGASSSHGGALRLSDGASAVLLRCALEFNRAEQHGGAVHCAGCALTLMASVFNNNSAGGSAGALWADTGAVVEVSDATEFSGNEAASSGGAMSLADATLHMHGSVVRGNKAYLHGGAIFGSGSSLTISSSNVHDNVALEGSGGGLSVSEGGSITVRQSNISWNVAQRGGGVYVSESACRLDEDTVVSHNRAALYGGGVCMVRQSSLTAGGRTSLVRNGAGRSGGAISVEKEGELLLGGRSHVLMNVAGEFGGGMPRLVLNLGRSPTAVCTGA